LGEEHGLAPLGLATKGEMCEVAKSTFKFRVQLALTVESDFPCVSAVRLSSLPVYRIRHGLHPHLPGQVLRVYVRIAPLHSSTEKKSKKNVS